MNIESIMDSGRVECCLVGELSSLISLDQASRSLGTVLPLVVKSGNKQIVVDGLKGINFAVTQGKKEISLFVVEAELSSCELVELRCHLNSFRPFTVEEKLQLIPLLDETTLEIKGFNRKELALYRQIDKADISVKNAIKSGLIAPTHYEFFDAILEEDRKGVIDFLGKLSLSKQQERELLEWFPEIAFREKIMIQTILSENSIDEIISSEKLNGPQKIAKLRKLLYFRRFPLLSEMEERWKKESRRLNPNSKKVKFASAPFFETNQLSLNITLHSSQEARELFKKLAAIKEEEWKSLIYPQ